MTPPNLPEGEEAPPSLPGSSCQVERSRDLMVCSVFDFAQTDKILLFIIFLLGQKETKTQDERPTPIFYPSKAFAAPPKKS